MRISKKKLWAMFFFVFSVCFATQAFATAIHLNNNTVYHFKHLEINKVHALLGRTFDLYPKDGGKDYYILPIASKKQNGTYTISPEHILWSDMAYTLYKGRQYYVFMESNKVSVVKTPNIDYDATIQSCYVTKADGLLCEVVWKKQRF